MSNYKLIVGLGNFEKKYQKNRHNLGFIIIDLLAEKFELNSFDNKFNGLISFYNSCNNKKIIFSKPQTFMNLSGSFVRDITSYYKIAKENILIIYDDVSLNIGKIKIKKSGSSGGHNGIKDIIEKLGTENILRVKIGIGPCKKDLTSFVLSDFSNYELNILKNLKIEEIIKMFINDNSIDQIMNLFN